MDDHLARQYFLDPKPTFQRRYEALRAVVLENQPLDQVAQRFGYTAAALATFVSRFRGECRCGEPPPFSSPMVAAGPRARGPNGASLEPNHLGSPIAAS